MTEHRIGSHLHCWHAEHVQVVTGPDLLQEQQVCCWCGETRICDPGSALTHGPYDPTARVRYIPDPRP